MAARTGPNEPQLVFSDISSNTQAILLLTAPLIDGRRKGSSKPLTQGEYRRLARRLRDLEREPADLLNSGAGAFLAECAFGIEPRRLEQLLGRGFLLSQALERWRSRAIWVVSRADSGYPQRLKQCLGDGAPPILYGCGDASTLNAGGIAIIGSRNVSEQLIQYTENVGRLTAEARRSVVSGGARGIDQAAMRGALDAGGGVVGILANGLEAASVRRENREPLMDGRLALISAHDPAARFNVGHAMQRNKLIYALADAALVVNSDYKRGGTWAGATEQLEKLKFVPVYVSMDDHTSKGLTELKRLGARPWPNPKTARELEESLSLPTTVASAAPGPKSNSLDFRGEPGPLERVQSAKVAATSEPQVPACPSPADELFAKFAELLDQMDGPRTDTRIAEVLQIPRRQASTWLKRYMELKLEKLFESSSANKAVAEAAEELNLPARQVGSCLKHLLDAGVIERLPQSRPIRYRSAACSSSASSKSSSSTIGSVETSSDRLANSASSVDAGTPVQATMEFQETANPK